MLFAKKVWRLHKSGLTAGRAAKEGEPQEYYPPKGRVANAFASLPGVAQTHLQVLELSHLYRDRGGAFEQVLELATGGELFDRIIALKKFSERHPQLPRPPPSLLLALLRPIFCNLRGTTLSVRRTHPS
jgi:hypothetical protein